MERSKLEVICVATFSNKYLTVGKIYSVLQEDDHCYRIEDDVGEKDFYNKAYFKPVIWN